MLFGFMRWESIGSLARLQQVQQLQASCAAMTQIPLSIEQTVAPQPKRSTATKLVVGLLGVFAVVCVYQQGHQARGASRVAVSPLHVADRLEMKACEIKSLTRANECTQDRSSETSLVVLATVGLPAAVFQLSLTFAIEQGSIW